MDYLRVQVFGDGEVVPGTRISRSVGTEWELVGITDEHGCQKWKIDPSILPVLLLFEAPANYWSKPVVFKEAAGESVVHLDALPREGPRGWWHDCVGSEAGREGAGEGLRVGVLDTGCGPSKCLVHVIQAGAWVDGDYLTGPEASLDISNHGTHVAGLVGARPREKGDYAGIAPSTSLVTGRVFSATSGQADQDDVANAIEALVENFDVHLINLSLGGTEGSGIEREAILEARERGTLVLAAVGNKAQEVEYPAAYPEVVAVSALGKVGEGSETARRGAYKLAGMPYAQAEGHYYPADFACYGAEINCVAPGVDIISTVPNSSGSGCSFGAMSGTSMSTPIACGVLAILLATDPKYMGMEETRERADYALEVLRSSCRDLGFPQDRQGAGLPTLP